MREAARRAGVGHTTMESWISRYRSEGISALEENGESLQTEVQRGLQAPSGGGVPVRSGAVPYYIISFALENLVLDWVKAYHEAQKKKTIKRNDQTKKKRLEANC